jgi:predicted dithiol-disulfide oxidoreductase (DUF899 family)
MTLPRVASREDWLSARKALLTKEKALTRQRDEVAAERRRLPMVPVDKPYSFEGPLGCARLLDLFEGRRQLIVYHFVFDPVWEEGCPSCSFLVDAIGDVSHLHARNTTLALVSRAPYATIAPYKARMGWTYPWYSSFGTDFNYDFGVTLDDKATHQAKDEPWFAENGEAHGLSTLLRDGDAVFHTYSAYARGTDHLVATYSYLDLTALGRQEDWEQPPGRSDGPFMHWVRRHDEYEGGKVEGCCHSEAHA